MWYVIQVVGGQEHAVIHQIEKLADETTYASCFIPQYEVKKNMAVCGNTAKKCCFPGMCL